MDRNMFPSIYNYLRAGSILGVCLLVSLPFFFLKIICFFLSKIMKIFAKIFAYIAENAYLCNVKG